MTTTNQESIEALKEVERNIELMRAQLVLLMACSKNLLWALQGPLNEAIPCMRDLQKAIDTIEGKPQVLNFEGEA